MPSPKLRLYFREPTVDTNMPITDGTVKIDGFEFEIVKREDDAGRDRIPARPRR